jgi:hypothetical protein
VEESLVDPIIQVTPALVRPLEERYVRRAVVVGLSNHPGDAGEEPIAWGTSNRPIPMTAAPRSAG